MSLRRLGTVCWAIPNDSLTLTWVFYPLTGVRREYNSSSGVETTHDLSVKAILLSILLIGNSKKIIFTRFVCKVLDLNVEMTAFLNKLQEMSLCMLGGVLTNIFAILYYQIIKFSLCHMYVVIKVDKLLLRCISSFHSLSYICVPLSIKVVVLNWKTGMLMII